MLMAGMKVMIILALLFLLAAREVGSITQQALVGVLQN